MQKGKRTSPDPIIPGEKELQFLMRATEFKIKLKERIAEVIAYLHRPIAIHIQAFKLAMQDRRERRKQELIELKKQALAQLKRELK